FCEMTSDTFQECFCKESSCNTLETFYKKPTDSSRLPAYTKAMEGLDKLGVLYHETAQKFYVALPDPTTTIKPDNGGANESLSSLLPALFIAVHRFL
ncbi:hypothetical protein PFISCL1PPCAC_21104, partial [Pristionchus fissidentatus]